MKKFCVFLTVFVALIFLVSCGGSSSKNNDKTDTGESVSDEDSADTGTSDDNKTDSTDTADSTDTSSDSGDSDGDTDKTDTTPDDSDSTGDADSSDSGDSQNDADADSGNDSGDSTPDEDADTEPPLPECSATGEFPCKDQEYGLVWSSVHTQKLVQTLAVSHCEDLDEGGFSDWRLPTIDELRTLLLNSPETTFGGRCKVSDPECLSSTCFDKTVCASVLENDETGFYSKLGDTEKLWSSSVISDDPEAGWVVAFHNSNIWSAKSTLLYSRCVRDELKIKNPNTCLPNPCYKVKYSTGVCTPEGSSYKCECDTNTTWNGSDCKMTECFTSIKTPCVDPNGTTWSKRNLSLTTYAAAESFCENLTEGGYNDWKLPDIDQLRSLIQNCTATETGSTSCKISLENNCVSSFTECPCGQYCDSDSSGTYSKFGDTAYFWSSTETATTNSYWVINFSSAAFVNNDKESGSNEYGARCVR